MIETKLSRTLPQFIIRKAFAMRLSGTVQPYDTRYDTRKVSAPVIVNLTPRWY
jgi:hypothetical protein